MTEENALWHSVSDEEKESIKKEVVGLLEEYGAKLNAISSKNSHFSNGSGMREEGTPWKTDETFKEILFGNAPFVEDDTIIAEKAKWKK